MGGAFSAFGHPVEDKLHSGDVDCHPPNFDTAFAALQIFASKI
ncbi:hypothetical protein APY04_1611 [Hyphomicrobium sulfonivorans]|uniref:Uncharacterized protein n=1 Tax=Hyphomicrobium sulfonivorans TaxID=121290 RepID=A0A120CWB4_HYPSL|nr:hypothetical protein APY04_1611 [Hyphomicrobium sulfonivorans]